MEHRRPDAGCEEHRDRPERDVREARHANRETGYPLERRQASPEHEDAEEAREPEGSRREGEPVEDKRERARRGLAGVAGRARDDERGGGGEERAADRCELGERALWPFRPVEEERDRGS